MGPGSHVEKWLLREKRKNIQNHLLFSQHVCIHFETTPWKTWAFTLRLSNRWTTHRRWEFPSAAQVGGGSHREAPLRTSGSIGAIEDWNSSLLKVRGNEGFLLKNDSWNGRLKYIHVCFSNWPGFRGVELSHFGYLFLDFGWLVVYYPRNTLKETKFPWGLWLSNRPLKPRDHPKKPRDRLGVS